MEAVNIQFAPATGTDQEWNEAYARLADFFRSYRLHNRIRRTQLVLESLRRASEAHAKNPNRTPVAYAIDEARQMMHDWLGRIYHDMNLTEPQIEAGGRLGFYISDGPEKWPLHFMDANSVPPEMSEAMRQAVRTSGPSLQVSKMTPRDIDLGFTNVAEDTFEGIARQPWMRYAILAVFVSFVFCYVYRILQ
ncbi:MAG: hypothetical protein ACKO8Z_13470 [Prosthecobacter sp.]